MQTVFNERLLAGLRARTSQESAVQVGESSPSPLDPAEAPVPLVDTPVTVCDPDICDPEVLHTMPPKVAAFMLYEPSVPAWRAETAGQRAERERASADGAWAG